ncbi:hypothetical protein H5368_06490 [Luteimonas sp. MC1782]|uniref:hypothetical protein n=1 Tax=Luteimonas sp. MC1782 TaxID=2760305 RepID=UPI0016007AC1|nr:hypothetical protein [Luteimonas sp. MC1782]MBB1472673.1 hypothetical protein [Luteimonas sp. MC1782]
MTRFRLLPCLLVLALAACGDDSERAQARVNVDGDDVAALPAPAQSGGSVTGMPDAPGPGNVPLGGMRAGAMTADGVAMVVPITGAMPGDGGLPPLEDNPETGLIGVVDLSAPPAPDASMAWAVQPVQPVRPLQVAATAAAPASADAVAVVRDYYAAITRGDHARAYAMWSDGGRSSGQTPEQFAAGFAGTRAVVQPGEPGVVGAGARLVEVPVSVTTIRPDGSELRYVGAYVLRRATADGSGAWRITSAQLREYHP